MYKCESCGAVFEEPADRKEQVGVMPYDVETFGVCPECGSENYYEAYLCEDCGEWFDYDETDCQFCHECKEKIVEEYKGSAQKCFDLCKESKMSVELNTFLASMFDVYDIEQILLNDLLKKEKPFWKDSLLKTDCSSFIADDESWFFDMVADKLHDKRKEEVKELLGDLYGKEVIQ